MGGGEGGEEGGVGWSPPLCEIQNTPLASTVTPVGEGASLPMALRHQCPKFTLKLVVNAPYS